MDPIIYLVFVLLAIFVYVFHKLWKGSTDENCFLKMVCTGKPVEPALSREEIHDILRNRFHPSISAEKWDAVVIGSGLSGLTVAKVLAASGRKVLVLEQHDRAGGSCHTFELDDYEFDVGIHYVQDMYPGKLLYRICSAITDSQAQWQKIEEPFDIVVIGKRSYGRTCGDSSHFRDQLKEWFPGEAYNIDGYFRYVLKCLNSNLWWFFAVKLMPVFIVRVLFKLGIINLFTNLFKYCGENLLDVMKQYKLSAEAQAVISYYFVNYAAPPSHASFFQHHLFLMESEYYPIGGATMITAHIIRSIQKFGGKVLVKADVQQISFTDGKVNGVIVKFGNGEYFIQSPLVVSTASTVKTLNELIPREIAKKSAMFEVVNRLYSLEAIPMGGFQAYIGLTGSQADLKLPSNNYFWFKNNNLYEIDHYLSLSSSEALEYGCPPMLYICFPSAKDPTWDERHPGISTCQIISFANPVWYQEFKDQSKKKSTKRTNLEEYMGMKHQTGELIFNQFLTLFPNVKPHVAYVEYSTPLTQQYYMQNAHGEYYSLTQQIERFKLEFWSELRCETDLPGLFLSGEDVLFCGIGSVLQSGLITAGQILKRNLYKDLNAAYLLQTKCDKKS